MTGRARAELTLTEDAWQSRVMDYAKAKGWRVAHVRRARSPRGAWLTPVSGSPGLPDLIVSRGGVVLLIELKTAKGDFEPGQQEWLAAAGEHGHCWRPSDWDRVLEVLA